VTVFFLNRKILKETVQKAVSELTACRPEIQKVILFGSVAEDRSLPSSDVDLLVITDPMNTRMIDRASPYLPYFDKVPLPVDCFVYTQKEVQSGKHPVSRTAIKSGVILFEKDKRSSSEK
jgi:predicted nucleotidyltransferase